MPSGVPHVTVTLQSTAKPWWRSKTIWLNAIVLALAAAESRIGALEGVLPVSAFELLAFVLPVLNVALRYVSHAAITLGVPPAAPLAPADTSSTNPPTAPPTAPPTTQSTTPPTTPPEAP